MTKHRVRTCLLDMDGVIADFSRGALAVHGWTPNQLYVQGQQAIWAMEEALGMTKMAFYRPMGQTFWADLPKTPQADEVVGIVLDKFGIENVYLCSAPIRNPDCIPGKIRWIKKHFPRLLPRCVWTKHKHLLARPDSLLLDDRERNIQSFVAGGGVGFIMPAKWNRKHHDHAFAAETLGAFLTTVTVI